MAEEPLQRQRVRGRGMKRILCVCLALLAASCSGLSGPVDEGVRLDHGKLGGGLLLDGLGCWR